METKVVVNSSKAVSDGILAASAGSLVAGTKHVMTRVRMSTGLHKLIATEENANLVDNDEGLKTLVMYIDPAARISDIEAGKLGTMFGCPVVADAALGERELVIESDLVTEHNMQTQ